MPTITRPTRVTQKSATLIDNVFISKKLQNNFASSILIDDISDHFPSIVFLRNQKICKKEPLKVQTREIKDSKIAELKSKLDSVNWENRLRELNADDSFNSFHTLLVETVETVLPETTKTIKYNKVIRDPWLHSCNSMPLVWLGLTICVVKCLYFLVRHRVSKITLLFCLGGSRQSLKVREVKCVPGDPATTCPVLFKGSRSLLLLA